jgi:hypothetical protein
MLATLVALTLLRPATATWTVIVEIGPKPKFTDMVEGEAREALQVAVFDRVSFNLAKSEITAVASPPGNLQGHEDDLGAYTQIGKGVDRVVVIRVDKWSQKNRSANEIFNSPNKSQSQTDVEVKYWSYDPRTNALTPSGKSDLKGTAGSVYFGTTDKSNMMGSPDAKAVEVRNVNRKRMQAIGSATWDALKEYLLAQ